MFIFYLFFDFYFFSKIQDGRHQILKVSKIKNEKAHHIQHEKTKKKHIRTNSVSIKLKKLWQFLLFLSDTCFYPEKNGTLLREMLYFVI